MYKRDACVVYVNGAITVRVPVKCARVYVPSDACVVYVNGASIIGVPVVGSSRDIINRASGGCVVYAKLTKRQGLVLVAYCDFYGVATFYKPLQEVV